MLNLNFGTNEQALMITQLDCTLYRPHVSTALTKYRGIHHSLNYCMELSALDKRCDEMANTMHKRTDFIPTIA
jgi:hypothetical protein